MDLDSRKVIITGAGGGMGAYFAEQLLAAGAGVAAGDIDETGLAALRDASAALPGRLFTRRLDVADEEDSEAFVDWAATRLQGVNALINNAGILRDGLLVKKDRNTGQVIKMSRAAWQAVIDVNLTGATWMVRNVAARMINDGVDKGVVVNMSSVARHGNRGQSNYVAAKAALAANTVTWARELARYGIRVGAIAPGMVETPMTQGMNQKAKDALVASVPLGRIGTPHDIWLGVRFVLENDYFTGRCLDIDGGLVM